MIDYLTPEQAGELVIGKIYLVPCIVKFSFADYDGGGLVWSEQLNPVINHPHNDVENGQDFVHYHTDYRFVKDTIIRKKYSRRYVGLTARPVKGIDGDLHNYLLPCIRIAHSMITDKINIAKSKLKHKCIHKGKCPHRGMDLTHVQPVDGIITCPLHGLQFDANTKQLKL